MGEVGEGVVSLVKLLNSEPLTGVTQELQGTHPPESSVDPL